MPLFEVTNGPTVPSGMSLTRNTSLVVEFDRAYSDGNDVYPMVYRASYDATSERWKPEGSDDGTVFELPGASVGDPVPPRVVFTELQTYLEGEMVVSRRELPGIVSETTTWDYASLPIAYQTITIGDVANEDAASILALLTSVDGPTSGLDADLLDGLHASDFYQRNQSIGVHGGSEFRTIGVSRSVASGAIRGTFGIDTGGRVVFDRVDDDASAGRLLIGEGYLRYEETIGDPVHDLLDKYTKAEVDALVAGGGGGSAQMDIAGLLSVAGASVKVVNVGGTWQLPDGTPADATLLAGRAASIVWEGTAAQIPAQGSGDTQLQVGDEARVRATAL